MSESTDEWARVNWWFVRRWCVSLELNLTCRIHWTVGLHCTTHASRTTLTLSREFYYYSCYYYSALLLLLLLLLLQLLCRKLRLWLRRDQSGERTHPDASVITARLHKILPPKVPFFVRQKMQISSKISPKIPNLAIFHRPKIKLFNCC